MANLPPKQKLFVEHYLSNGFNASQAVISAGYAKKNANVTGCQLLANPNIQQLVSKAQQKTSQKLEITRESILLKINKVIDHVERLLSDGMAQAPEMNAMLKGLEQQAKMLGLNEPEKVQISNDESTRLIVEVRQTSNEDLAEKLSNKLHG